MHGTSHVVAEESAGHGTGRQCVHEPLVLGVAITDDQRGPSNDGRQGYPLIAVSAAALAAPYGVVESGGHASTTVKNGK